MRSLLRALLIDVKHDRTLPSVEDALTRYLFTLGQYNDRHPRDTQQRDAGANIGANKKDPSKANAFVDLVWR